MAVIDESALTAAKIRDMPISAALRRVLLMAAQEAGVEIVRITSGGQPGSRGQRVGSNRHDGGNAADLELVAQGRTLDFTRPADLDTICRFVASAAACGATGIGAGVNYMGPRRLHVGFGNGAHDTTQIVWGEDGAATNAPGWLRDAAQLGWSYSAGSPIPEGAAPQPPVEGEVASTGPPPESPGGFPNELDALIGALNAPSARADRTFGWMARGAVAVIQLCSRLPVTGAPDAETLVILIRFARPFRVAGWLIAALGVVGLARSAGGSGPVSVLDALDRFRATLGASADPALNAVFDFLRQGVAAAKPAIENFVGNPPWSTILLGLDDLIPGAAGSLVALGLGLVLHRFGAKLLQAHG
jgi:hypothetical protein